MQNKNLVKIGTLILLRDISKFLSISFVSIPTGMLLGAHILHTLYRFNILALILLIIIGLVLGLLYLILRSKCSKLIEEELKK